MSSHSTGAGPQDRGGVGAGRGRLNCQGGGIGPVGCGLYSLAHASGLAARPSLLLVSLALGIVSMAAIATAVWRRR